MRELLVWIHAQGLGYAVVGSWAILACWGLTLRFTSYEETPTYWRAVSVAQVLLALQLVVGMVLLTAWTVGLAGLPGDGSLFEVSFHLLYGFVFPLVVLVAGHRVAYAQRLHPHTTFALVGLINFGLTARAWQVGSPLF